MSNLYGLIGEKLGHSLSPVIHGLLLNRLKQQGYYDLFEIERENIAPALYGLKVLKAKGVNVTIPYKVDVMDYMDKLSAEAERIGAVNTVAFENNILSGYNTDYFGFGEALKNAEIEVKNKGFAILGTGGASKAVVQYLIDNNAGKIVYISRNPDKAQNNYPNIRIVSYKDLDSLYNMDAIINCTPLGMHPDLHASPVDPKVLSNFKAAVDLIYNPEETQFLKSAASLGLKTLNGLYMLVAQAAASQEIWNGIAIDSRVVEDIYNIIKSSFYGD